VWGGAVCGWWLTRKVQTCYLRAALAKRRRPLLLGAAGGATSPAAVPRALLADG
jgi:hypothetical protein